MATNKYGNQYNYIMNQVKVFGKEAQLINEGDSFVAKIDYVEGRKVAILEVIKN